MGAFPRRNWPDASVPARLHEFHPLDIALQTAGRSVASDYADVMFFEADKIKHVQKIWNAGLAMRELGWA